MKKNDKVKIIKGNGIYNNKEGVIKSITDDIVLIEGEGLSGAMNIVQRRPIPNSRYVTTNQIEVI